jgi:hypothetical protein
MSERRKVKSREEAAEILKEHARTAKVNDLIPSGNTTKVFEFEHPENPEEMISVTIKRINMKALGRIGRFAKEDAVETIIATIKEGVVDPKLTVGQIGEFDPGVSNLICTEILEFSNLRPEDVEAAKNS